MAISSMSSLVFVTTNGTAQVPISQRGLIRSHCMREKNKQPQSRRSKREARRLQAAAAKENERAPSTGSTPTSLSVANKSKQGGANERLAVARTRVPPAPPSDWALIKLPVELDRTSQKLFHRYFACNPIRDPVFPFKLFGIQVDVHTDDLCLSSPFTYDEMVYRAMDLMVSSSNDLIYGCGVTNRTRRKLAGLLPMLNRRLVQPDGQQGRMTLYVVGILASIATLFADYTSASVHAKGISEIIRLRGSSKADRTDLMLGLVLDRLSFSSSLLTDKWTPLHADIVQEGPQFPEEVTFRYEVQGMVPSDCVPDSRLALVFYTLQCTTILLDTHDFGAPRINGARLYEALGFVQSELLRLKGRLADSLSDCIRLGLMAFLATTFRVPGQYEHPCCASLAEPLLGACVANGKGLARLPKALRTWLLLVGAMTAGAVGNDRVRLAWRDLLSANRDSWDVMRQDAKKVMWVDVMHDALGKNAFDALGINE